MIEVFRSQMPFLCFGKPHLGVANELPRIADAPDL
jgi:hypothetical protein